MKRRVAFVTIASSIIIAGAIATAYQFLTPGIVIPITSPTPVTVTQPKKIMVSLPGADPVVALEEDYNKPTSQWVVVSKDLPLSEQHYRPSDLQIITSVPTRSEKTADERSLRTIVMNDLNALFQAASAAGYNLMIGSGFRSYSMQEFYYSHYVAASGEAAANKFSAKPGQSEHQTGLAFDISLVSKECYLDTCFGDTAAGKWLAANAVNFGFIIRYPADKVDITKYQYEPWHLRYVGKPLATALNQSHLTLDEAYPYLQTTRTELIQAKKISGQ